MASGRWILVAALALSAIGSASLGHGDPCSPNSIGVDTSVAKGADFVNLGEAIGQTFTATDTVISCITFWRNAAVETSYTGFHLYVVGTDSTGEPVPAALVLNGPTVFNPYGDGSHAIPFRFVFNPPLLLPRSGTYEAAVQANPCDAVLQFLFSMQDDYPGGQIWFHSRTSTCTLRAGPTTTPTQDMIFSIEFCGPSTPAQRASWGRLKAAYR
jgi:hypothetical protein